MGDDFEVIGRFDGEDDLTPKLDNIAAGFQRVTDAATYLAEITGQMGGGLEGAVSAWTALDEAARMAAQAVDGFAKQSITSADALGQLNNQTGMLAKEMQTAWFEIDHGVAQMDAMSAAAAGMDGRMSGLITSMGVYDDALANAVGGTRTLADGTIVARESLQTAGAAALLAASQTRVYDESLRGVDVTLQMTAREQQALADECNAATQAILTNADAETVAAEKLVGFAANAGGVGDELAILTQKFNSASLSASEFLVAGYKFDAFNAGLTKLAEKGDAAAAALALLNAQMGGFPATLLTAEEELSKVDAQLLAMDNAMVGMEGVASGVSSTLEGESAALASVGTEAEVAAAKMDMLKAAGDGTAASTERANTGFGISQFLLFTLGMMALGVGKQFVTAGTDVANTMDIIQGMTQSSDQQMQAWSDTLSQLGQKFGMTQDVLVGGLELITKAGFRATDATDVLSQALMLAHTTGNTVAESANLLLMSMNAYGAGADQAAAYTNILFDTLSKTRLTMQDFTSLMGNSLPIAAGLGISFSDLSNAVAVFSQNTASGMIATRDLQSMLAGLQNFADLSSTQIAKLAGNFDLAKYATLDFTAKLADLAAASGGSEKTFTGLIGGAGNADTAIKNLDISTKQLAINAANLGVSFDPVKYNALDAAGKLLYLMSIVDDSGPKFAKLTDGTKGTNAALSDMSAALDAGGKKAAEMSSQFNKAAFNTDDFAQKLHDLADFFGGTGSAAFLTYIGGAKNLQEALRIMGTEADKHHEVQINTAPAIKSVSDLSVEHKRLKDHLAEQLQMAPIDDSKTQQSEDRIDRNAKTAGDRFAAAWSDAGKSVGKGLAETGPALDVISAIIEHWATAKVPEAIGKGVAPQKAQVHTNDLAMQDQTSKDMQDFENKVADFFTKTEPDAVRKGNGPMKSAVHDNDKVVNDQVAQDTPEWLKPIEKFFTKDEPDAIKKGNGPIKSAVHDNNLAAKDQTATDIQDWLKPIEQFFTKDEPDAIKKGNGPIKSAVHDTNTGVTDELRTAKTDWMKPIDDFIQQSIDAFQRWMIAIVGKSIVPDMVAGVLASLTKGGTDWLTPITTFITTAEGDFTTASATLTAIAGEIGANINTAFVTAGATWNATVGTAMSTVVATVESWVSSAFTAGADVANAIGDGIESAVGWIKTAAGDAASAIAGIFQHLSPPKEGPLHTDDQWMPNMVKMMASGITDNTGTLRQAAITAATSITMPLQSVSQTQFVQSTGNTATDMTPVVQILVQIYQVLRTQQMQGPSTGGQSPIRGNVSQQQMLATLYQMLNGYGGFTFESGARGAYAGLGV